MPDTHALTALLRRRIRKHNVPGAAVAIWQDGRVTEAAAGVANVDTRVPVTVDTVFQIGSITKVFTATLIMQLVDQKRVALDEPVKRYLPGFRVADTNATRSVTLRHLLCHSSGIDGDFFPDAGRGDDAIARLMDMCAMLPQLFPPGERMSYSNVGFAVLGRVIEVVTGETFDAVLKTRLLEPLGVRHAMSLPEDAVRFRCAIGHVPDRDDAAVNRQTPLPYLSFGQKAAGATPTMSARAVVTFAGLHIDGGRARGGRKLLNKGSVTAMQRRQVRLPAHTPRAVRHWGLGWFLCDWNGTTVIGHDGGTVGQYAFLRVLPEAKVAVALLTNGGDATLLYQDVLAATFGRLTGLREPPAPVPDERVQADAARLTGRFENIVTAVDVREGERGLTVSTEDKAGTGIAPPLADARLAFIDPDTAVLATGNALLDRTVFQFSGGGDGAPAGFVGTGFRVLKRV